MRSDLRENRDTWRHTNWARDKLRDIQAKREKAKRKTEHFEDNRLREGTEFRVKTLRFWTHH